MEVLTKMIKQEATQSGRIDAGCDGIWVNPEGEEELEKWREWLLVEPEKDE